MCELIIWMILVARIWLVICLIREEELFEGVRTNVSDIMSPSFGSVGRVKKYLFLSGEKN